ncbi:IMP dehydrogenase [Haliangium ochraceum]|uniref:Inosine-5'-monophosphate dehydrogenase n=1 Tax=Haliangium ochraceum (strain DSM 14365 / JCM 11303 / SMP-2) TaxID=502025 RepID=D0LKZ1_HALO1|nr:IMP dehydrogenase [Haliangium ochraceum]ACY16711.1 inosine-5'-monophosphate dehydrogenase [Haliangium ochraceum DSM 14365]
MIGDKPLREALTFDDVLLLPAESRVLPRDVDVSTRLTTDIELGIPLVSAAMDTVTESATAIRMAREGGIGIVHKNLTVEEQALEVVRVKKAESGIVVDPVTVDPERTVEGAIEIMRTHRISGLPVVDGEGRPLGILTNRDVRFERNLDQRVGEVMTKRLITVREGVSLEESKELLHENRIEKLLVVDAEGRLRGLITIKDIEQAEQHPHAAKDELGRLRVGAAVGVGDDREARVEALVAAGCDVIAVDTAHGHAQGVIAAVRDIRERFPDIQLIAGNVATGAATQALIEAGANAIKVGVGPGSICTTRVVAGVGVPQLTAVSDCVAVAAPRGIPVIADGGIKHSGDVAKAIAAGANSVMIGSLFAGTDEAPGELVLYQGRSYKTYRGMGSIGAMRAGSRDRYFQAEVQSARKLVPEGIEGRVPYRGRLHDSLYQLVGGLRSSMGYVGCADIDEMRTKPEFMRITSQGLRESHVHDVIITKEAPNYHVD